MFIKKHATKIVLFLIVLVAVIFRFANFPQNPPSLNWDEVSIGYNAHSIIETGKDEFGNRYPLYFRSLDDYKQPVYIYLVAGAEKILGFGEFTVRFPSAFFGVMTVILIYFLTYELFKKKIPALLSALIFAILPWSVQFSRYALEANAALFFFLLGLLLYLYSIKKKFWLMPVSFLFFILASYTYLSYKVIIPIFTTLLIIITYKKINLRNIFVLISIFLLTLNVLLIFKDLTAKQGQTRFAGSSILNDKETFRKELDQMQYEGELKINLPRRFFHEIPLFTNAGLITRGYLKHLSPDYLFFDIGQKLNFTPNAGLLYIWMLPFIIFGFYSLIKKYDKQSVYITFLMFLIAPIPASVTYDSPHAIRVFLIGVPIVLATSIGIYEFYLRLKKHKFTKILFVLCLSFFIFIFSWQFYRQYQIHLPRFGSEEWQYGRREMTEYIMENRKNYDEIIVSSSLEWPHIFVLYYSKYSPSRYLLSGGTRSGSWDSEENELENIYYRKIKLPQDLKNGKKVLLVGKPDDFPVSINPSKIIFYLNNKPAVYFIEGSEN